MSDTRIYAVASGKGGVGKTTTAVNLGAAAAAAGCDVVVVDFDLGMANLDDVLDLGTVDVTLHDALAGDHDVEDAIYNAPGQFGTARGVSGRFDVVPGGTEIEDFGRADPSKLHEVVDDLQNRYDLIVLDTGGGLSHDTTVPLGVADGVILVSTPRAAALNNTSKTRALADRLDADVEGVLLTRVSASGTDSALVEDLDAPLLGTIPEDRAVPESEAAGEPLETAAPAAAATHAYRDLAVDLLDISQPREWADDHESGELLDTPASGGRVDGGSATPPNAPGEESESDGDEATDTTPEDRSLLSRLTGGLLG